jgi:MFS family permease
VGRHRRPAEEQATYGEVFRVAEFRHLWLAQTLSSLGDQLAQVALAVLVYHRTQSPLLTALTYALTYLPPIVGGPVLSGLADVLPRRRVMIVCDLLRAGLVGIMALEATPFALLCALVFVTTLLGAPFSAARAALLPDILDGDRYVVGAAINNITHQASQMLGFVAGGALVAVLSPQQALGADAVTFLISALIVAVGIRKRKAAQEGNRRSGLWRNTRDGARLVFRDPTLRSLVSFAWLCAFYVIPEGLAAPYAATFGHDALYVGVLMAAMPTGMVAGSFLFSKFVRPSGRIRSMGWMSMIACAPLIGCGFVAAVPPAGRGQAFGLAQSGILAGQGLGILIGGALAQVIGPELVVALAGMAGLSVATMLTMIWTEVRGEVLSGMFAPAVESEVGVPV